MDRDQTIRQTALAAIAIASVALGLLAAYYFVASTGLRLSLRPHPVVGGSLIRSLAEWKSAVWIFSGVALCSAAMLYFSISRLLPECKEPAGDYGSAHWATAKEIAESGLLSTTGIVIGAVKYRGQHRLLRYDGEGHTIVVSPSRSGKGVTVVVSTGLTWPHSILFNDIKGELWPLTAGWRKQHLNSLCFRFDATCDDGTAARWNPLFEVRPYPHDVRDAQNIALTLASSDSAASRNDNERHWRTMGVRLIKALILHQLYAGRDKTLTGCYHALTAISRDVDSTLKLMLETAHDSTGQFGWTDVDTGAPTRTHQVIAHIARDMLSKTERERGYIISSAVAYLELFDDPIIAKNVSTSDFSLSDLMHNERPVSLYLTTPVGDLERVQPLHRLFFTLAGTRNTERLEFRDGQPVPTYKHPLLEVFDEFAHLGYTPVIQKHFSLASGFGIHGLFVFQDFSQLFELYGRNESITSNCDVKVAFAPNNLETASYISRLLGVETREKREPAKPMFGAAVKTRTQSIGRPLLTPDECSRLPRDKSIILKNGCPPIMGDKVPYYKIRELLARSRISPPESDRISCKPHWSAALPLPAATTRDEQKRKRRVHGKQQTAARQKAVVNGPIQQVDLFPLNHNPEVQHDRANNDSYEDE